MESSFSQATLEAQAFRPFSDAWSSDDRWYLGRPRKQGSLTKSARTLFSHRPRRTRRGQPISRLA